MNTKTLIILVVGVMAVGVAIHNRSPRAKQVSPPQQTERVSTRRVFKPRRPAPHWPVAPSPDEPPPEDSQPTNLLAWSLQGDTSLEVSRDQVESCLAQNQRSAECLLAAIRAARDRSLLQEATEKYPNEPRVSFAGGVAARSKHDASPEECRQWLDAFKQSAPDNAPANYLSAQTCFKSGQTDRAVEERMAASAKPRFQDYSADCVQNLAETYLSAGCPESEAKAAAACSIFLPQLSEMKHRSESLRDLAALYRQAGDEPSAQAALQMGLDMGQRLDESAGGSLLNHNLTGLAIERRLLGALDPNTPYGNAGQTVQCQLDALTQRVGALKGLWKHAETLLQSLSDQDLIRYFDRMKVFGELEALRWVMNRQGNR